LFYESPERRVMVADSAAKGDSFVAAKPRAWSDVRLADTGLFSGFSPAPDGKRVLVLLAAEDAKAQPFFHLLLNVDSELRRRVAARRP
jgi:hypothetical protein